jgi:hypothetical protein
MGRVGAMLEISKRKEKGRPDITKGYGLLRVPKWVQFQVSTVSRGHPSQGSLGMMLLIYEKSFCCCYVGCSVKPLFRGIPSVPFRSEPWNGLFRDTRNSAK